MENNKRKVLPGLGYIYEFEKLKELDLFQSPLLITSEDPATTILENNYIYFSTISQADRWRPKPWEFYENKKLINCRNVFRMEYAKFVNPKFIGTIPEELMPAFEKAVIEANKTKRRFLN